MKVHAISFANAPTFPRKNKQQDVAYQSQVSYDTNKVRNTLLCIAALGAAGLAVALVKDGGNNSVKTAYNSAKQTAKEIIPDEIEIGIWKKRDALAVEKYNLFKSKEKLAKLEERIASGEFKNLPTHALANIERQKDKLTKICA